MTTSQRLTAYRSQIKLATRYLRQFERTDGNSPEAMRLYVLWSMHSANAKLWATRLEG